MLEAYLKSCQVSNVIRHNENHDIVKIVYLSSFRHIWRYLATLSYVQTLREIKAYRGITEAY